MTDIYGSSLGGYYDAGGTQSNPAIKCSLKPSLRLFQGHISIGECCLFHAKTLLIKIAQSFALMSICWGATDFGKGKAVMLNLSKKSLSSLIHTEGYDMANQTAYLDSTLRWGLDWLIKVAF